MYSSLVHAELNSHLPTAAVPGVSAIPYPTGGVPLPIQSKDALVTGSSRLRSCHNPTDNNAGTGSDSGFSDAREFLKVPMHEPLAGFDEEQDDCKSLEEEENPYAQTTTVAYYKSLRSPPLVTEYTSLQPICQEEQVPVPEHIYDEPPRDLGENHTHNLSNHRLNQFSVLIHRQQQRRRPLRATYPLQQNGLQLKPTTTNSVRTEIGSSC